MPKMNIAFSLDEKELKDFDDWRKVHVPPLARGTALMLLLEHWRETQHTYVPARIVEADDAPY